MWIYILRQGKNRPPTRRNPAEIVDKSVHELDLVNQSPNNKYQTTSLSSQTVTENSCSSVDHHEYLQFSLHITEEIIRNDMFKNEEMISVLKRHYEANKSRLDQVIKAIKVEFSLFSFILYLRKDYLKLLRNCARS